MEPISGKIVWIKITKCLSKPKKSEPGDNGKWSTFEEFDARKHHGVI